MTLRRPLVMVSDVVSELPAGDTVAGATGGGGSAPWTAVTVSTPRAPWRSAATATVADVAVIAASSIELAWQPYTDANENTPPFSGVGLAVASVAVGSFAVELFALDGRQPIGGDFKIQYRVS